ncbi:Heavy metal-associated isoprenylated plant protein 7 [Linum grandiflorum]
MGAEEEKKPVAAAEVEKKPEEEKKPEKPADEKPAETAGDEKKDEKKEGEEVAADEGKKESKGEDAPPPPPPPPQEIVLKVFMHCEGCARKVRRCLKGFDGVEDVTTDCKSSKVVVKGEKAAADPLKVLERIQRKSHRQVELISPIPKPPSEDKAEDEKPKPPAEEPKPEPPPPVITVVLQVYMHCEACAMEIKKRIQRMKGMLLCFSLSFSNCFQFPFFFRGPFLLASLNCFPLWSS